MVKVLELFSGTRSVGKCCDELGLDSVSVDLIMPADHQCDIMDFNYQQYPRDEFDIIWASPPCCSFSLLQGSWIGRHKRVDGELVLFTEEQRQLDMLEGDKLVKRTLEIINYFNPEIWFMENPQSGKLKNREYMKDLPFYDVDYCKYSDWGYRKRTRIWTNKKDWNNLKCECDCGYTIGKKHINNLGNAAWREHGKKKSKNYSQTEKYRIPEDLIYSLLMD
tara:strand:+ start:2558 stop:3220 length:663 start_codon:yes stop_codon:yes gene_type:complete